MVEILVGTVGESKKRRKRRRNAKILDNIKEMSSLCKTKRLNEIEGRRAKM